MKLQKLLMATVILGIVWNVYDFVVHGMLLAGTYEGLAIMRTDSPMLWLILGEFFGALVFIWVYDRVYDSFGGGVAAGARFGMYAGVLINFPLWLYMTALFVGFPYGMAWLQVVNGIVFCILGGAVAGAVYKKEVAAA